MRWAFGAISLAVAAAAACSSFSGDPAAAGTDAGGDDAALGERDGEVAPTDAARDADAAISTCDVSAPFVVAPLKGLDTLDNDEYDAVLFDDEIFFTRSGSASYTQLTHASVSKDGGYDFAPVDVPHGPSTPAFRARNPTLAKPGTVIHYLERGNDETSGDRLWVAQRSSTNVLGFEDGGPVFESARNGEPVLSAWFTKTSVWLSKGAAGSEDIYAATFDDAGVIGPLSRASMSTTGSGETYPILSGDEKTIFFASNATASVNPKQGTNIWVAHFSSTTNAFGNAQQVDELSTDEDEVPTWISPDGCRMLIARTSSTAGKKRDVWLAAKPPLP